MIGDLKGKIAFITGGAGGIGLGMAHAFAGAGMKIAIADIDAAAVNKAVAGIEAAGGSALAVQMDVADWSSWTAAAATVEKQLGPVQLLCNNAGVAAYGLKIETLDPPSWKRIVDINLNGVHYGVHCFLAGMREAGGGHIVNTASMAGLMHGVADNAAYVATKFAVVGLSESMQAELEPDGIGVSVLCPGVVRTGLWQSSRRARGQPEFEVLPEAALRGSAGPDGLDPYRVGLRVLDAIRNDEFYIITHAELRSQVVARHQRIMAAFDRAEATRAILQSPPEISAES